jgi:hypothetical protein
MLAIWSWIRSHPVLRDIERTLVVGNLVSSLVLGLRHDPAWFVLAMAGFGLYVVLADRALRRRVGPRHWPSEGFARFTFNTNLYFAVRHLFLGALLFVVAGMFSGMLAA